MRRHLGQSIHALITALMDAARELHPDALHLKATPAGRGLYEELGFVVDEGGNTPMTLNLP